MKNHIENTNESGFLGMLDLLTPSLLNEISEVIIIKKPDHTILYCNRAGYKMLAMEPEEVIGRKCYELMGKPTICEDCSGNKAVQAKKSDSSESFSASIGKWLEVKTIPICNKEGNVIYILEILCDLTRLKKLQDKLSKYESGNY